MAATLIADAGATKTHWCLLQANGRKQEFTTAGINPYLQNEEAIEAMLLEEAVPKLGKKGVDALAYYGAGATAPAMVRSLKTALRKAFGSMPVSIEGDMLGAARAMFGDKKGVACILGTGSNACYYNGKKISRQSPSLGWIAGDEGSGNFMGKAILQHYFYGVFDDELRMSFEALFGSEREAILERLYKQPYPNRYLGSLVQLLRQHRGHFMVENIIEDSLNEFFRAHVLRMPEAWKYPIAFCGSLAYEFRETLQSLCSQYELECGTITASPMPGLLSFYKNKNKG